MSASIETSAIFINDTPKQIEKKINRYAFSGGQDTAELHRLHGGDLSVDVSYQYLRFFLDDDEELDRIGKDYAAGTMSTGELKKRCSEVLQALVKPVQEVHIY
jgi:tryptophanyl-tRNA synthetase